jgi:predicted transcriptional regulator
MTVACATVTALLDAADKGGVTAIILAKMLGVTRQTIYLYRDGMVPDDDKLAAMQDLTRRILEAINNNQLPRPKRDVELEVWEALNYPTYKQP